MFIIYRQTADEPPEFYAGAGTWIDDPRFACRFERDTQADASAFMHSGAEVIDVRIPVSIEWSNGYDAPMVTVVCTSVDDLARSILMRLRPKSRDVYRNIVHPDLLHYQMVVTDQHAGNGRSFRGYWLK